MLPNSAHASAESGKERADQVVEGVGRHGGQNGAGSKCDKTEIYAYQSCADSLQHVLVDDAEEERREGDGKPGGHAALERFPVAAGRPGRLLAAQAHRAAVRLD